MNLVYILLDPRDGAIRYVGITETGMGRPSGHGRRGFKRPTNHYHHWVNALRELGLRPRHRILFEVDDASMLDDLERTVIEQLRAAGCDLVNSESGGRRAKRHSQETKEKISRSNTKNREWNGIVRQKVSSRKIHEPLTEVHKEKLRKPKSEETKLKMSESHRGVARSLATRTAISVGHLRRKMPSS